MFDSPSKLIPPPHSQKFWTLPENTFVFIFTTIYLVCIRFSLYFPVLTRQLEQSLKDMNTPVQMVD